MRFILPALAFLVSALPLLAQDAAKPAASSNFMGSMLPMMIVMFVAIYFLMIRPEQKKAKLRQQMLAALQKGDRVVTAAGIIGVVGTMKDNSVLIKTGDNTILEFTKGSITTVLNDDGTEKKAETVKEKVEEKKK